MHTRSNTQETTLDRDDSVFTEEVAASVDLVFEYTYLVKAAGQCIFGCILFGYNASAADSVVTATSFLYEDGAVTNSKSSNDTIPAPASPAGGYGSENVVLGKVIGQLPGFAESIPDHNLHKSLTRYHLAHPVIMILGSQNLN